MPDLCEAVEVQGQLADLRVEASGTFSYVSADGATGWRSLAFSAFLGGQHIRGRCRRIDKVGDAKVQIALAYPPFAVSETVTLTVLSDPPALTVDRVFRNEGEVPVSMHEVRTAPAGAESSVNLLGKPAGALRVVHVSNIREGARRGGWKIGPYVCPLPQYDRVINDSEGHPFPALAICDGAQRNFILEGSLQQEEFNQTWLLNAATYQAGDAAADPSLAQPDGGTAAHAPTSGIFSNYAAIACDPRRQPLPLAAGQQALLSSIYYQIIRDRDLQDIHDDYLGELNRRFDLWGKRSPMLAGAHYCTWNYTFYHNITEQILRQQCQMLSQQLPNVKYFLIDDGYQLSTNTPTYDLGKFYPDADANIDPVRFPNGMKAVADMIKSFGLKPCLWWSPAMGRLNRLVEEHPEWLCYDEHGHDWSMDSGPHRKAALDFSVPAAREFVEYCLETILVKWGYVGMKLDFCTYPFDSKDIRFRNGRAIHWWNWFLEAVRKRLPDDGFFELCGGARNGSPFLGRWCDNHRIGGDIGKGEWERQLSTSHAPTAMLHVPGSSTLLMDMDSAGVRLDASDDENITRMNWCYISQGSLGIGGDLTQLSARQLEWLSRITETLDRGHKVYIADRRAFTGEPIPDCVFVNYPAGSRLAKAGVKKEIGLFNWENDPKTIGYALSRLGIKDTDGIFDFWTHERVKPVDGQLVVSLRKHASRLFQVR